jgi:hypothetical protein
VPVLLANGNKALQDASCTRIDIVLYPAVRVNLYPMLLSVSNMAMCCCAMAMRVFTPRQKGS